ncbi:MAG: hypothetical protein HN778_19680 [Prolixibacteraceae bacterium]|jgi:hypothetical protein|nr:hypothetical protein [Prolixibacteraceae bacterium]MBT6998188.1 hypothetical protein [Prolixibacteraceae bacterium]MBT7397059.1 hypothetical protein [Prolixibacteraceae bacterium]
MKKYVIFLFCLILSSIVFVQSNAQNLMDKNDVISPKFKGDERVSAILTADNSILVNNYLLENVVCPKSAAECQKEGTEIVQFTVTKSGNLTDFKVINSVCTELDKEVIRVLKTTNGMWNPALKDGEPVAIKKEVAFMFGAHERNTILNYFTKAATRCHKKGSKHLFVNNNPKNALRHYNIGINYMPNDKALLMLRGICHFELGNKERASLDWNRIEFLGGIEPAKIDNSLISMKGYSEMIEILANNNDN